MKNIVVVLARQYINSFYDVLKVSIDEKTLYDKLSGYFIIIGKKKFSADGEIHKKFGFRWFIPTILKFKKQFISVLMFVTVTVILIVKAVKKKNSTAAQSDASSVEDVADEVVDKISDDVKTES